MLSMSLEKLLAKNKMSLIVSIPRNEPALANAAMRAGADAIKMHVNVDHWASGNNFASTEAYVEPFRDIREQFSGPLGIVPGGSFEAIKQSELEKLSELGFNYFSIYAHHMPTWMLQLDKYEKTFAITGDYSIESLGSMHELGIAAIEASIIQAHEYGSPLTFKDILAYHYIVQNTDVPVMVPSQRLLLPSDMAPLYKAGVKAVMLGAVVIGQTEESIERAVASFKNELDKL
ncbi:hypothetical protein [Bacillus sp. FSL K6-3431]|uniref:hypothetical protein n=1 Tax=Bacillus sp. FSL K6-3431 TaxID=2921500 RepID=UPI0030FB29AF